MLSRSPTLLALMALTAAAAMVPNGPATAQTKPAAAPVHLLPQSIQLEHKEALEQLTALTGRKGQVGIEAAKVLVLLKKHIAREEEFILPPLTLLPELADGKVTPDMAWALAMTDRVKAEREQIFEEHVTLTEALNGLVVAATQENDMAAKAFAESLAANSLGDLEIYEPTLLLINETLRSKLPAAH